MAISNPVLFLASDRELAEEAWAGDIIGIPNHGQLRIGDTLTEGEALRFTGIPSFAPELLQTCRAGDPMKAKHLDKALMQFAEEGAAKVFKPDHRLGLHRRRGGRAAIRGAGQPDRAGIRPARAVRAVAIHLRPLGDGPEGGGGGVRRANKQHMAPTMTATRST
jgi:phage tail tape-measure protein